MLYTKQATSQKCPDIYCINDEQKTLYHVLQNTEVVCKMFNFVEHDIYNNIVLIW